MKIKNSYLSHKSYKNTKSWFEQTSICPTWGRLHIDMRNHALLLTYVKRFWKIFHITSMNWKRLGRIVRFEQHLWVGLFGLNKHLRVGLWGLNKYLRIGLWGLNNIGVPPERIIKFEQHLRKGLWGLNNIFGKDCKV